MRESGRPGSTLRCDRPCNDDANNRSRKRQEYNAFIKAAAPLIKQTAGRDIACEGIGRLGNLMLYPNRRTVFAKFAATATATP
jgi:hypothetical protein